MHTLKKGEFIAILYGISDVGNIGAIVRTAYALGVDGLIFIGERLAMEGVIRTSSGAALDLEIALNNDIFTVLNELKQVGFKLLLVQVEVNKFIIIKSIRVKKL